MKKILFALVLVFAAGFVFGQTTYYWVGNPGDSINITSNWNTVLNGSGNSRPSNTGTTDILVFDGSNLGAATPFPVVSTAGISAAQLKFVNNAIVQMVRSVSGTTTIALSGDATAGTEDFLIEIGSSLMVANGPGSQIVTISGTNSTGRVSGNLAMVTGLQAGIRNGPTGGPTMVFTAGSTFTTNITPASAAYAFGNSTQSSERWVIFEAGSHLYYDGGFSPYGSGNLYSAMEMKPGSTWHHRATNATSGFGNFFNRKGFANIIVENNANLVAEGPIYRIENLTINSGSTFTTHTSGQTAVLGNIIVNGSLTSDITSTNELLLGGNTAQSITGSGTISVAAIIVADNANVTLSKDIAVDKSVNIYGKLDFNTFKLTGNATFRANGPTTPSAGTGNLTAGSFMIKGNSGVLTTARGLSITGTGIPANTSIVSFSATSDSIFISNPVVTSGTGVALSVQGAGATLQTAHLNGFNPASGSASVTGTQTFNDGVNYVINGATTWPFGVTTGSTATPITARFIDINAPVTINRGITVSDHLKVAGKITLRPLDLVRIMSGAVFTGTFNSSNYIATVSNSTTGDLSVVQYDGLASSVTIPIGTVNYYLPVTLNPASSSSFTATVFEGITYNGAINGVPFTPSEKQNVVNAVWNINRLSGSGNSDVQLGWNAALEGSTFATLPNSDIGLIRNTGSAWSLPLGTGNNTTNTVTANLSSFGPLGAGAIPQVQPFIFNALPPKTYGNPDFNGGATSLNTTQPIVYTSNNPAVATIVAGNIHITGAGSATITASQASDGFYPAATISQTLTVSKAALTITADNKTKFQGQANPPLTITYTGFVLGETATALLTQPVITTTAVTSSPAGTYPITVTGATSNNYTISFVNGTLTVQPQQNQTITFAAPATKTYGNADFAAGATSTNTTIPITYTSSNTAVATIIGSNIHIVGAGTANITASQAGNAGFFPAPDVVRPLIVNKANLAIRVRDTLKVQGQPNPPFTITYTGFVLGETATNLLTPVVASTTAIDISSPGYYPITLSGGTSNNYNVTFTNGRLTILPASGTNAQYMNAFMSNSTTLTVRVYSPNPALGDIMLYDMSGHPLLQKNLFMPVGFISVDIPVSRYPAGIYIVTLRGDNVDLQKTIRILK